MNTTRSNDSDFPFQKAPKPQPGMTREEVERLMKDANPPGRPAKISASGSWSLYEWKSDLRYVRYRVWWDDHYVATKVHAQEIPPGQNPAD